MGGMVAQTIFLSVAGGFIGAIAAAMVAGLFDAKPGSDGTNLFLCVGILLGASGLVWAYG